MAKKNQQSQIAAFEFVQQDVKAAVLPPLCDTRTSDVRERFTIKSETLADLRQQLATAAAARKAGQPGLPYETYRELNTRATKLAEKDARLAEFWKDAQNQTRGLQCLNQLTTGWPEDRVFTVSFVVDGGEVLSRQVDFFVTSTPGTVPQTNVDGLDYRQDRLVGEALHVVTDRARYQLSWTTVQGLQGVLIKRAPGLDGEARWPVFVAASESMPVYTVIKDKRGAIKALPFTDTRFERAARKWQMAALLVMGHDLNVVLEDLSQFGTLAEQQVKEGFVFAQFGDLFGDQHLPYERQAWCQAHYPQAEKAETVESIFDFGQIVVDTAPDIFSF